MSRKIAKFNETEMKAAVIEVIENEKSVRSVAKSSGLCHMTLKRYVDKYKASKDKNIKFTPNYDVNKVFSKEMEEQLEQYLLKASKMHHGLTRKDTLNLAYELAVRNNLKIPKNWVQHKCAGIDWLVGFRKRHPAISLRKPEATSLARATSFNRASVSIFFENLKRVYKNVQNISPEKIYNLDETALTTVHNPPNVLTAKGQKQVGQVTSGERDVLVTACCTINAIGNSIPPYLIFPRVYFKTKMLFGAPPGTVGSATKSGWMNGEIFQDTLRHFQRHSNCSKDNPVILIFDNHESHVTIGSIEFCKENGIILVTLPPRTSNKLQPLDKTVYKSLKSHYNTACNDWMISNPGKTISIYDISGLLGKAYPKAFTPSNICAGFSSTGIWPLNSNIFSDDDFLSSEVTDRPVNFEVLMKDNSDTAQNTIRFQAVATSSESIDENILYGKDSDNLENKNLPTLRGLLSPEEVKPLPKAGARKNTKKGKKKKSLVLTETPLKDEIIAELNERDAKKRSKKDIAKKVIFSARLKKKKLQCVDN